MKPDLRPPFLATLLLLPLLSAAAGCGGGYGDGAGPRPPGPEPEPTGGPRVVAIGPAGQTGVAMNRPVAVSFDRPIDPRCVRDGAIRVVARDGTDAQDGNDAEGAWEVDGVHAFFRPRVPSLPDLSDGGLRPGVVYRVVVAGREQPEPLRSRRGRSLARTVTAEFRTALAEDRDAFTADAYRIPPPPVVIGAIPPDGAEEVPADAPLAVLLGGVPVLPSSVRPGTVTLRMRARDGVPEDRDVPGTPFLEQDQAGGRITFRPAVPLASRATYALRIGPGVTDLTGRHPVAASGNGDASEGADPWVATTFTTRAEPPREWILRLRFDGTDRDQDGGPGVDVAATTASFDGAVPGAVAAGFPAAGGTGVLGDFAPTEDVILSTDSPSAPGGVFAFRSIRVPAGVTVTLRGSLPARLVAARDAEIRGTLLARGGRGTDGESEGRDPDLPAAKGGAAGPGGGAGGGSYTGSSWAGSLGGRGGNAAGGGASGGGGGSEATTAWGGLGGGGGGGGGARGSGAPGTDGAYATRSDWNGVGGGGGAGGPLLLASTANRDGRDFSLATPGGAGGGAGGNSHYYPKSRAWMNGAASGGGGGGAVLVQAAGSITVKGVLDVRGGDGGDAGAGDDVAKYGGAAGGGGGGGSVALYAAGSLVLAGARIDASGGAGGATSGEGWPGIGGAGGEGDLRFEDGDGLPSGLDVGTFLPDYATGTFAPVAREGDPPTVFTGTWIDTGLFDPEFLPPLPQDVVLSLPPGCAAGIEIQAAPELPSAPGRADESRATPWLPWRDSSGALLDPTPSLNGRGCRLLRVRIAFTLPDGHAPTDPRPFVDEIRVRMRF